SHGYEKTIRDEIAFHRQAQATIIQDRFRADALMKHNGINEQPTFIFPVSVRGEINRERGNFWHGKYGLVSSDIIILYFGLISQRRLSDQFVELAGELPLNVYIVLHGPTLDNGWTWNHLEARVLEERVKNIRLSRELFPEKEIVK